MNDVVEVNFLRARLPAIQESTDPAEVINFAKVADAVRKSRASFQVRQDAAEAWLWAERRLGELLRQYLVRGRPKKVSKQNDHFTLVELGMVRDDGTADRNWSSRAQEIADIPIENMTAYFGTARMHGWEITWDGNFGLLAWRSDPKGLLTYCQTNDHSRPEGGRRVGPRRRTQGQSGFTAA